MPSARDADDPSPEDGDDELDEDAPRSRRASHRPRSHSPRRPPVRKWSDSDEEDDDEEELETPPRRRWFHRDSKPVYWRARDSLYFEPLIAVAIIVLLLVGLYAYTQNWPPVYVVESDSMQHGSSDVLGVINTGDLVLAQRISLNQITPYVVGVQTGYSTYGEPGDVILYNANGQGSTPIIHRAILFLEWDPVSSSYNATDISGLKCGNASGDYRTPGTSTGCALTGLTSATSIELYGVGWRSVPVSIPTDPGALGDHSGFVTMGDNNFVPIGCASSCSGDPDQVDGLSQLVEPGWIVGVARGMIPWVGAVKLLLEGDAQSVPAQSWQFLGLTVVGLILLAFGIHYALRAEGIEDERRREREDAEAEAEEEEEDRPPSRGRRFLRALRPWKSDPDEDDIDEPPRRKHPSKDRPSGRRGRPTPKVRRESKGKSGGSSDDDDL